MFAGESFAESSFGDCFTIYRNGKVYKFAVVNSELIRKFRGDTCLVKNHKLKTPTIIVFKVDLKKKS